MSKVALLAFFIVTQPLSAQSSIGSGGDVLQSYVEEIGSKLHQTLLRLKTSPDRDQICNGLNLSGEQKKFCNAFIKATMNQYMMLTLGPQKVPLKVVEDKLFSHDADGNLYEVAAITRKGPEGDIKFNYKKISNYHPAVLLALLTHEIGHKIEFPRGNVYVDDNDPIGPFAEGRDLLDAAGHALSQNASRNLIIGPRFSVKDKFTCGIKQEGSFPSESTNEVRRIFSTTSNPFGNYRFGVGPEFGWTWTAGEDRTCISFELSIQEMANCNKSGNRATNLKLVRYFPEGDDGMTPNPELIEEKVILDYNPACSWTRLEPLELNYHDATFYCVYRGFRADTWSGKTLKTADGCP